MTRKQQIEQLVTIWESLGDGRVVTDDYNNDPETDLYYALFRSDDDACLGKSLACLSIQGTDTEDATPCLAILRDVYGEDVDVFHTRDEDGESWSVGPVEAGSCYYSVSFVSRIDSVTLALEANTVRGGV